MAALLGAGAAAGRRRRPSSSRRARRPRARRAAWRAGRASPPPRAPAGRRRRARHRAPRRAASARSRRARAASRRRRRALALEQRRTARGRLADRQAAQPLPRHLPMARASEASDLLDDVGGDDLPAARARALDGDSLMCTGLLSLASTARRSISSPSTRSSPAFCWNVRVETRALRRRTPPLSISATEPAPRKKRRRPSFDDEPVRRGAAPADSVTTRSSMRPMRSPSGFSTGSFLIREAKTAHAPSTAFGRAEAPRNSAGNRAWWTVWVRASRDKRSPRTAGGGC